MSLLHLTGGGISYTSTCATTISEGGTLNVSVGTTGVANGTTLYWTILNGTTSASDFSASSGSFTVTDGLGSFNVVVLRDATSESTETFSVQIRTTSTSGVVVATTPTISITNVTYAITPSSNNVNEGSSVTFNITTTNLPNGTVLYWTINRTDFSATSGSVTINSNAASFSVTPTADATTEGSTTFTASLRVYSTSGTIVATSSTVTINDTSVTPYNVFFVDSTSTAGSAWGYLNKSSYTAGDALLAFVAGGHYPTSSYTMYPNSDLTPLSNAYIGFYTSACVNYINSADSSSYSVGVCASPSCLFGARMLTFRTNKPASSVGMSIKSNFSSSPLSFTTVQGRAYVLFIASSAQISADTTFVASGQNVVVSGLGSSDFTWLYTYSGVPYCNPSYTIVGYFVETIAGGRTFSLSFSPSVSSPYHTPIYSRCLIELTP